jgi:penicillin-binding protein 1A
MRDPFNSGKRRRRGPRLIEVDAWIDTSVYRVGQGIATAFESVSIFMRRFRVMGFKRTLVELAGDGLTLGCGGLIVMLALALPAFEVTRTDWRKQGEYSITILDRYGAEIGKRGIRQSDAVPLEEYPDHLIKAVLATEDRRFFEHFGIDALGTFRAMMENLRANSVVQGGSSLSQQLAKNLFLSNERTLERKVKEAFLALWLESNLSKREILKLYLDRAYMGGGNFGVEAASEFYFNKSAKDVNLAEAALLAGLFKAPARFAPHINLPAARARANEVLTNMVQAGFLTEGQVIGARRRPADVVEQVADTGSPDYFLDWVFEEVTRMAPDADRVLTVRSTIDPAIQKSAEESIERTLRENGEAYRVKQAAVVAIENDGAVRAMIGGRDYGESQFNRAVSALRQPGSSFKPYVYTTAMMNGFTPETVVRDGPICIGNWCPRNYSGGYSGAITLTTAIVKSINTIPVQLAQKIGRDKIVEVAHAMGINSELRITRSLPLGASEVTVIDQAAGYASLASGGYKTPPYGFTQIITSQGEVIYDYKRDAPPRVRVLPEEAVRDMNLMLSQVPEWGTGKRAKLEGIKTAGKTGTASAYRDAWFVGYTGNFTAAVWMGNDDFSSTRRLTGGVLPASVWHDFMTVAHQGIELKPIPFIDNTEPEGEAVADAGAAATPAPVIQERPDRLSEETATRLRAIEKLMRDAPSLRPVAALWPPSPIGLSVPPPPVFTIPPPRPADAAPVSTNAPAPPASPSFIQ